MRTRGELESALNDLGWQLVDGPRRVHDGWRATIRRGTASASTTGRSEIGAIEELLRSAEARAGSRP